MFTLIPVAPLASHTDTPRFRGGLRPAPLGASLGLAG